MTDEKGSNSAQPSEPIFDESWGKPEKRSFPPGYFGGAKDEVTRPMEEPDPRGSMFDGTVFDRNYIDTSAVDKIAPENAWQLELEEKKVELREAASALTEPSPINRSDRQHER